MTSTPSPTASANAAPTTATAPRSARGATRTAHSASVIAAVECPLGQEPMSTPRISPARGCPSVDFSVCVVRPVTTSSTVTAPALAIRPRRSATPDDREPDEHVRPLVAEPRDTRREDAESAGRGGDEPGRGRRVDRLDGVGERGAQAHGDERDQARQCTPEGGRGGGSARALHGPSTLAAALKPG